MKMMSSTAFPNVTFISAATVSPHLLATLSVAWLRSPASGTMAIAFRPKTTPAGICVKSTTNTSASSVFCKMQIKKQCLGCQNAKLTDSNTNRHKHKQDVHPAGQQNVCDGREESGDDTPVLGQLSLRRRPFQLLVSPCIFRSHVRRCRGEPPMKTRLATARNAASPCGPRRGKRRWAVGFCSCPCPDPVCQMLA